MPETTHAQNEESIELPIDGTLDLHLFHPRDIKTLVPDYLELCREKGILEVRVIHGKGIGALRETVHATLRKISWVLEFNLASHDRGHWGATIVKLKPEEKG